MAGVQTAKDNKAVLPSQPEVGSLAKDLSSALTAYLEELQKAVDQAVIQAFWRFGIDDVGSSYSRGTVKVCCAVGPSGRFLVARVLNNTSNRVFAYAALDAVRMAIAVPRSPGSRRKY
jgi:hypothetical protein